jgi:hypothetical protein
VMALSLGGCGSGGTPAAPTTDWTGSWAYSHLVGADGTTCSETGVIQLAAAGARLNGTFSGRGGCESASGSLDYAKTGPASGQVNGDGVVLTLTASQESCLYQGKLDAGRTDEATGAVVCTPPNGGVPRQGSWSMKR